MSMIKMLKGNKDKAPLIIWIVLTFAIISFFILLIINISIHLYNKTYDSLISTSSLLSLLIFFIMLVILGKVLYFYNFFINNHDIFIEEHLAKPFDGISFRNIPFILQLKVICILSFFYMLNIIFLFFGIFLGDVLGFFLVVAAIITMFLLSYPIIKKKWSSITKELEGY